MDLSFAGKTALVIGGSGGIGRETALALAGRGANLIIHGGSSSERLESALAEIRTIQAGLFGAVQTGAQAPGVSGFLHSIGEKGVENAVESILGAAECTPDILVCAWGPFKKASLTETTPQMWRFLTESNLIFPGILISRVLCDMITKKWGRILLFGGTCTGELRGYGSTAAYSAAKTALGVLAKSAARTALEAGTPAVTCNVICPGLTDTGYTGREEREFNRKHSPGGAMDVRETALTAVHLLENAAINGAVLPVDRGIGIMGFDKVGEKG
jgi:NAD(P)-dependent dehydrogenase (short-subunit alcohol dehydrogenase family)